jgi:RNA polymerase sigma factor (sigma-70 family)
MTTSDARSERLNDIRGSASGGHVGAARVVPRVHRSDATPGGEVCDRSHVEPNPGDRRRTHMVVVVPSHALADDEGAIVPARPRLREATDATVIERSWAVPDAFAELFQRHADELYRYLARRHDEETADDLLGETFAVAFQQRRRYDVDRADARPWLYGIATNLGHRHRRAEVRRLRALSRTLSRASDEPIAERLDAKLDAQAARGELAAALAQLSVGQRDVVVLIAWADLDYGEVAEALNVPVGTVRSRLHRARHELRRAIALHLPTAER